MGNSNNSLARPKDVTASGTPHNIQKLKLMDIDPRSPTDGILRTPIIIDKPSGNQTKFGVLSPGIPFDTSGFEPIDGCVTDDDSMHYTGNTSAFSDTAVIDKSSSEHQKSGAVARLRKSLQQRVAESPSLFVKMRQKQRIDREKRCLNKMAPPAKICREIDKRPDGENFVEPDISDKENAGKFFYTQ